MKNAQRLLCAGSAVSADSDAGSFRARAVLRDGTPVCVRAIRPDDKDRLRIAFERLSPRSVYQRFLHPVRGLTFDDLRNLTELDFCNHVGLVASVEEQTGERLIAVGRFVRVAPGADIAELGFAVADEYQHRGAATLLLHHLVDMARRGGVREFVALVLEDNRQMLEVFEHSNLPLRQSFEDGACRVALSIPT